MGHDLIEVEDTIGHFPKFYYMCHPQTLGLIVSLLSSIQMICNYMYTNFNLCSKTAVLGSEMLFKTFSFIDKINENILQTEAVTVFTVCEKIGNKVVLSRTRTQNSGQSPGTVRFAGWDVCQHVLELSWLLEATVAGLAFVLLDSYWGYCFDWLLG